MEYLRGAGPITCWNDWKGRIRYITLFFADDDERAFSGSLCANACMLESKATHSSHCKLSTNIPVNHHHSTKFSRGGPCTRQGMHNVWAIHEIQGNAFHPWSSVKLSALCTGHLWNEGVCISSSVHHYGTIALIMFYEEMHGYLHWPSLVHTLGTLPYPWLYERGGVAFSFIVPFLVHLALFMDRLWNAQSRTLPF